MKVYNTGKKILLFKLISYINKLPPGSVIMDLGCGTGDLTRYLADHFKEHNFIGEDIHDKTLSYAKLFRQKNVTYIKGKEHKIPVKGASTDIIFSTEVIEHTDNDELFVNEIKRVIRKNGIVAITTPNGAKVPFENTNPDHKRHYKVGELKRLFLNSGFRILKVDYRLSKKSREIDIFLDKLKEFIFKPKTFQPCITALSKKEKESRKAKTLLFLFDFLIDPIITIMAILDYKINASKDKYNIMVFCKRIK